MVADDHETELYVEIQAWDAASDDAVLHTKVPTVSDTGTTTIYLYFDSTESENTSYVDDTGETAALSVWDSNFAAVYHMVDETTTAIAESTGNVASGQKAGDGDPAGATGKVGSAQNFNGSSSEIDLGTDADLNFTSAMTFEAIVKRDVDDVGHALGGKWIWSSVAARSYYIQINTSNTINFITASDGEIATEDNLIGSDTIDATNYYHIAGVYDGTTGKYIYVNGAEDESNSWTSGIYSREATGVFLGVQNGGAAPEALYTYFDGIIDEVRFSSTARDAEWVKATYHSTFDTLVTYSAIESL